MADENLSEAEAPALNCPKVEQEECPPAGAPEWMATFSDLVTLLMCFFVLMYAMSTTQQETFKELVESLRSALGVTVVPEAGSREGLTMQPVPAETPAEEQKIDEMGGMIQKDLEEVVSEVRELVMFNKLGGLVTATQGDMGAVITMTDMLLFEQGGATLSDMGIDVLRKIASVLSRLAYHVKVKGHTDNVEVKNNELYPSNWELSAARASAVVRLLVESGLNPKYISAEGYAEFKPVATNDTPDGRSRNRRVEIVYDRDIIARDFVGLDKQKK
ncbi:MAG: flagellar motor protein MotB [Desulfamplus sp.]|nr:flagellar motor protein MotB [Desulfamplus sp.]